MNLFKRAYKSLIYGKIRTTITIFSLIILILVLGLGLILYNSANESLEQFKTQSEVKSIISLDYAKLSNDENSQEFIMPPLTENQINEIGNLSYVSYFDYSIISFVLTNKLENWKTNKQENTTGNVMKESNTEIGKSSFFFMGVNSPIFKNLKEKEIEILKGNSFSIENIKKGDKSIIISKELADLNNLTVNDTLEIDFLEVNQTIDDKDISISNPQTYIKKDYTYNIIGLFDINKDSPSLSNDKFMQEELLNTIYVSNKRLIQDKISFIKSTNDHFGENYYNLEEETISLSQENFEPYFILKNSDLKDDFEIEANEILKKSPYHKLYFSTETLDAIQAPINNIKIIGSNILIGSIFLFVTIVFLITTLSLRERKKEIAIFLTLGESKLKIYYQIMFEYLILFLLALVISISLSFFVSKEITIFLQNKEFTENLTEDNIFTTSNWNLDIDDSIYLDSNSTISLKSITQISIFSFFILLFSISLPIIKTLFTNPKKYLT